MPIDPDAVGTTSEPFDHSWESKDCLLYALGVGAGTDELAFTTENSMNVRASGSFHPSRGSRRRRLRRHVADRRLQHGDAGPPRAGDRAVR
ncbi:MAG: hypothetical protein U5R31_07905 [Acidimicrobiia bacterium]|nr:hypothetical protein [Acidimicrobiia bacterium]